MPDAFFQSDRKRKRANRPGSSRGGSGGGSGGRGGGRGGGGARAPKRAPRDEDLSSDAEGNGLEMDIDDMDFTRGRGPVMLDDDEFVDANETAAEKRVRLARGYLDKVRKEVEDEDEYDAAEIDRDLIASRLREEVDEAEGRIHRFYGSVSAASQRFKSTQHVPTAVGMTAAGLVYVSTKSGEVMRFDRKTMKSRKVRPEAAAAAAATAAPGAPVAGHKGAILSLAASEDGKWVVTGGQDKIVGVWDVSDADAPLWVAGMRGHKDAVSSVVFPPLANTSAHVLSASLGRHLTLHSLSTLSALDTFFGHQDSIPSVSALKPSAAVTAGSRDRTCRWWKVEEEVQLVLRGGGKTRDGDAVYMEGSVDVVCVLDDSHFVSGGDTGSIALWSTGKKKPIFTLTLAHGVDTESRNPLDAVRDGDEGGSGVPPRAPRWITSLAALRGTNLFASGSWDGRIRLWALDAALRTFTPAGEIDAPGFVNGMQLLADGAGGAVLAAALAREPRLGRWICVQGARNGLLVANLAAKAEAAEALS